MAKLTPEIIEKITGKLETMMPKDIAGLYGVPISQVYYVKKLIREQEGSEETTEAEESQDVDDMGYGDDIDNVRRWAKFWQTKYIEEHIKNLEGNP